MKITKYNNVKNISGNKLKDLRKKCKMSQKELAENFAKIFKVSTDEFNDL